METYTDNEGRTVLERRIHTDTKGTEYLDTYYVYDDLNRLRYVLPPQAEEIFRQAGEIKDGADRKTEYTYDENGNLTQDLNRNIEDIQYNFLNLPQRIEFGDGSTTEYLYDADGRKLRYTGQTERRPPPTMQGI